MPLGVFEIGVGETRWVDAFENDSRVGRKGRDRRVVVAEIRPRQVMVYSLDRDTPCPTLEKVTKEELQAIAARVEALGIPCSAA